jgi:RNA polymerase sigma-70 factor (ECF subfamily)
MGSAQDVELIGRIQACEQEALGLLYDQLAPLVHAVILRILGDRTEAEEVLGETFWQVWNNAERYDPSRGTVAGWVLTMARSRALDALRARRRREAGVAAYGDKNLELPTSPALMPETVALQGEQARAVAAALKGLSEEQRLPIELAYYEGLSQTEIAGRLGQPLGTIKTRIRLGLLRLRNALGPYLGERA